MSISKYLSVIINIEESIVKDELNERIAKTGNLFRAINTGVLGKAEVTEKTKVKEVKRIVNSIITDVGQSYVRTVSFSRFSSKKDCRKIQ